MPLAESTRNDARALPTNDGHSRRAGDRAGGDAIAQGPTAAKPRIAVFSGPNATIQNNKPLVTSNKAREQYGLPMQMDRWGRPLVDWPRYQRLAAPVTVYIEMFTAHPLESDARELYGPPDGYVDSQGRFSPQRKSATDKPVYAVTLKPEDGLYALPYMGRQANGQPWESAVTSGRAPQRKPPDLCRRCLPHLRGDRAQRRRDSC